jgi:ferredoxin-NADP reductase
VRYEERWSDARVRSSRDVSPTVRLIEIEPTGGARPYPPGSHVNVGVTIRGQPDVRSYSLVGDAPTAGAYRIAVQHHDDSRGGSAYMRSLRPGAPLSVSDPHNLFPLSFGAPEYLLVAGGIGITPLVGMAHVLARRRVPFRLLYACRHGADMPFADELSELLGPRLTRCASDEGRRLDLAEELHELHPQGELYLCGPMRLMDAARRAWAAAERPPTNLRFETFASSGAYAPEPFVVEAADHGMSVEVSETQTMLEALRDAGIDVMYDCLRGECGLCTVEVVSARGQIDHRDVFLSEEEKAEQRKLCTCVSRAVGGGITVDTGFRREHRGAGGETASAAPVGSGASAS